LQRSYGNSDEHLDRDGHQAATEKPFPDGPHGRLPNPAGGQLGDSAPLLPMMNYFIIGMPGLVSKNSMLPVAIGHFII
jgi:hypothetical protein